MKKGLFIKLGWNNICKNYRFFIPRILSEAGLTACFYIALTLTMDKRLAEVKGGSYISDFMGLGTAVLAFLSFILMLYVNSFLMKQRKREFGLYNVLGLEKRHIGRIMFNETFISSIISVSGGLALGVLFYKLCSLIICRLLQTEIVYGFYFVKSDSLIFSGIAFILLDFFIYTINIISVSKTNPLELLQSKSAGEREPKVKWPLLIIGILALGGGYYISLSVKKPLDAILWFFVAIILVIVGTYFLFVSGSTFILKLLRKNEKYYYDKKHMPAVSGLLYRMKQNAVGLASIAILATGVLVMLSTTVSLYFGMDSELAEYYPQHMYVHASYETPDGEIKYISTDELEKAVRDAADNNGLKIGPVEKSEYLEVSYMVDGNKFLGKNDTDSNNFNKVKNFVFITEEKYNELTGKRLGLTGNEIATCCVTAKKGYDVEKIDYPVYIGGEKYDVKSTFDCFPVRQRMVISICPTYGIVVSGQDILNKIYISQKASFGKYASEYTGMLSVSFDSLYKACGVGDKMSDEIEAALLSRLSESGIESFTDIGIDTYWRAREACLCMYGTFLFLGILLGAVCMFSTVLIIYYKQISEGMEDRARFRIMERVGMSHQEVKKTINSQVLLVFFLPLIVAAVHLAVSFPMMLKLLKILMLSNTSFFIMCTVVTFVIFALIYSLIYKGTSKTYYKIVH